MHVDIAHDPRGIDDDDRPLWPTDLVVEHAVRLRDLAVWPEVAAERVLRSAERIGPGFEGVDAVAREAQDLGSAADETLL